MIRLRAPIPHAPSTVRNKVPIVTTSAGMPDIQFSPRIQSHGLTGDDSLVERCIPLWCQPQAALHVSPEPDGAELGTLNPSSSDCLSLSSVPLISDSSGCHRLAKYCDPRILGQSIPAAGSASKASTSIVHQFLRHVFRTYVLRQLLRYCGIGVAIEECLPKTDEFAPQRVGRLRRGVILRNAAIGC
jgi:hypothetical protein